MIRRVAMAAALAVCGWGSAVAGSGTDALNAFFGEITGFSADFKQSVFGEQSSRVQVSSGRMVLRRPGQFRWDYEIPYRQLIIGDGKKVWIYDEDLEQVTVRSQAQALGDTPAQLLSSGEPLENNFTINELGRQGEVEWLELLPLDSDAAFKAIRLAFQRRDLVGMELEDGLGNETVLSFTNVQLNPAIDRNVFVFEAPPGVDVIGDP